MTKKNAFTLIELTIVMTVIALLSSISLFALQGARKSSRDAKRKGDLEAIRSALELYRSDCGFYPDDSGDFKTEIGSPFTNSSGVDSGGNSCGVSGTRTYLTNVPSDPQSSSGRKYHYNQLTDYTYELCADLEEDPATAQSCIDGVTTYGDYKVTNP